MLEEREGRIITEKHFSQQNRTTFNKIRKTLEALQDFAGKIVARSSGEHSKNSRRLEALEDFGGKMFSAFRRAKRL